MSYISISNFGASVDSDPQNDPLTYCALSGLESGFNHNIGSGSTLLGPNSAQCQQYMGRYCGTKWDGVCEYLSNGTDRSLPNTVNACNGTSGGSCFGSGIGGFMTSGQILIRNSAAERFLIAVSGNCIPVLEPFDPLTPSSPLMTRYVSKDNTCDGSASNVCIKIYDVDAKTIDNDIVMNKILSQPWIAMDILTNIYNTRVRNGKLQEIAKTKLGSFFNTKDFQQIVKSKMYRQ